MVDKSYPLPVRPLPEVGADPDLDFCALDGATALYGHTEIVAAPMEAGADPKVKGPEGKTASEAGRLKYGDPEGA